MKKSFIVWMGVALMMAAGMSSCSSDDEEKATGYDYLYHVSYFDQDPNLNKQQGYWYDETFIGLTPQKEPPYYLVAIWDSEEGEKALNYIVGKKDGVILNRYDLEGGNRVLLVSNKYISCPYLYISSSYTTDNIIEGDYIRICNMIIVKMKEGKSAEPIATKYAHSLKPNIEETKLSKTVVFDCILNTSYEVLQLAEEINQRDDVEWAEPDMWIPFHTYSRTRH